MKLDGLDKGKKLTNDKLRKVLMKSMFKMEELAINNAPHDQGELRQKITLYPVNITIMSIQKMIPVVCRNSGENLKPIPTTNIFY